MFTSIVDSDKKTKEQFLLQILLQENFEQPQVAAGGLIFKNVSTEDLWNYF